MLDDQANDTHVKQALGRLHAALGHQSSLSCLRLWSAFVRLRDDNTCLGCGSKKDLSAHHVIRKTLLMTARFDAFNGITLCRA